MARKTLKSVFADIFGKLWADDRSLNVSEEAKETVIPLAVPGVNISKNPPPRILPPQDTDFRNWVFGGYPVFVESSNVVSIQYDINRKALIVRFKHGATYVYTQVPPSIAAGMFCSDSMGKYLDRQIKKGGYGYYKRI